jgi:hypothetical protein
VPGVEGALTQVRYFAPEAACEKLLPAFKGLLDFQVGGQIAAMNDVWLWHKADIAAVLNDVCFEE